MNMFKGIHLGPKNQWLDIIDTNLHLFRDKTMAEKLGLLEQFASQINGIGPATVMETYLLWIERI